MGRIVDTPIRDHNQDPGYPKEDLTLENLTIQNLAESVRVPPTPERVANS